MKRGYKLKLEEKIKIAVLALADKKAKEINCTEIGELTSLADCFLMATATSSTHVKALADEVDFKLGEAGEQPRNIEGRSTDWILLDYGDLIVHIFGKNSREFYSLDKMWSDGIPVDIEKYLAGEEK